MVAQASFVLNGQSIAPGSRATIDLSVSRFYTHAEVTMPVQVLVGRRKGPVLFVSAAIHGDEINGVEVIRRLLQMPQLKRLRGVLIAVPVVNVHGFINHTRYLPDRRDLNRSFPGSECGSLTARLAYLFMSEIVAQADYGIDIHTGANHRANLPQIRADLDHPETAELAEAFGVPVLLNSAIRDGSLRQVAAEQGIPMLLYEAGEALRFDETSIRIGVRGVINVMRHLGMLAAGKKRARAHAPFVARSTQWVRAPISGILRSSCRLGSMVDKGTRLGFVADPFGESEVELLAPVRGILIGRTNLPLTNEGDALFHIARFDRPTQVAAQVEAIHESIYLEPPELQEPAAPDGAYDAPA